MLDVPAFYLALDDPAFSLSLDDPAFCLALDYPVFCLALYDLAFWLVLDDSAPAGMMYLPTPDDPVPGGAMLPLLEPDEPAPDVPMPGRIGPPLARQACLIEACFDMGYGGVPQILSVWGLGVKVSPWRV